MRRHHAFIVSRTKRLTGRSLRRQLLDVCLNYYSFIASKIYLVRESTKHKKQGSKCFIFILLYVRVSEILHLQLFQRYKCNLHFCTKCKVVCLSMKSVSNTRGK